MKPGDRCVKIGAVSFFAASVMFVREQMVRLNC